VEWVLFALAYTLVGLRIGIRLARRQQRNAVVSDIFLIVSALVCLGLIVCEYHWIEFADLLGMLKLMIVAGDTLTYTLGAMRPETATASVVTADADAKQLALNKVSVYCWLWMYGSGCVQDTDWLLLADLFRVSIAPSTSSSSFEVKRNAIDWLD